MAFHKRIMISLPDTLLEEIDDIVANESVNRSEFIREAMRLYIEQKRRLIVRDEMKQGYLEMASINLKLANESFIVEQEAYFRKKWQLAEGE